MSAKKSKITIASSQQPILWDESEENFDKIQDLVVATSNEVIERVEFLNEARTASLHRAEQYGNLARAIGKTIKSIK